MTRICLPLTRKMPCKARTIARTRGQAVRPDFAGFRRGRRGVGHGGKPQLRLGAPLNAVSGQESQRSRAARPDHGCGTTARRGLVSWKLRAYRCSKGYRPLVKMGENLKASQDR